MALFDKQNFRCLLLPRLLKQGAPDEVLFTNLLLFDDNILQLGIDPINISAAKIIGTSEKPVTFGVI